MHIKEVEKPSPKDNQVLIRVCAVSINDWDWALIRGEPYMTRLFTGLKPKKQILGSDIGGIIEAVGKNVQLFKPGDEVFGDLSGEWGGFAEYVCADENKVALKPPGMTFEEAAAIPQAGMLAVQGLRANGQLQPGQKLLINGAGGGVGTFAIQIAKLHDVEVTAVDKSGKFDMLRSMGVSNLIDYTKEDFTISGHRYDLILDVKTTRPVFDYLRALKPNGTYATVGGSMSRLFQTFTLAPWIRMFTNKKAKVVMLKTNKDLPYMIKLFEAGKVKPIIDGHYGLLDIRRAFEIFARGDHKGKIVITVAT